jgi:hypothetical protein
VGGRSAALACVLPACYPCGSRKTISPLALRQEVSGMGASISPAPEAPAVPSGSPWQRLVGIFWSPGSAFAEIARRPDFVLPLALLVLTSVLSTEGVLAKIGIERIIRISIEQSGQASKMSPEQMQQAIERGVRIGGILAHITGFLTSPVILLIAAGIGLLIVNGIFGGELNFKAAFSIASYAYLPTVVRSLMGLALAFFGDPDRFNPRAPTPSSLGFFLNPLETSKPLFTFLSWMDIFTIWFLVLLAIGLSAATNRKVKPLGIFFCYFGVWMVLVLGSTAFAALSA